MRPRSERTALYRFYGFDGDLLYVGISHDPVTRSTQHASRQPWWDDVERQTVIWFDSRDDARTAEKVAIRDEGPLYNLNDQSPLRLDGPDVNTVLAACLEFAALAVRGFAKKVDADASTEIANYQRVARNFRPHGRPILDFHELDMLAAMTAPTRQHAN